jgi:hypothetical protein
MPGLVEPRAHAAADAARPVHDEAHPRASCSLLIPGEPRPPRV